MNESPAIGAPAGLELDPNAQTDRRSGLWRNRDYRLIVFGQGLSAIGDAVSLTALPLLVLLLTGSGLQLGIVGAMQFLPDLVFGLPAGALADRWDRRRMMFITDLARGALTALIPLSVVFGLPTMAVTYVVILPIHLMRVLWLAAYTAAVPSLVGREQIGAANSYLEATYSVGWFVGPGIAGLLAARIGPGPTIGIDSASFVLSAMSLLLVRRRLQERTERVETRILHDIREGVGYVARHPVLRVVIGFWAAFCIANAGVIPCLAFYVTIDRDLGPEAFGFVLSAYSVGAVLGALATGRLMKGRVSLGWLMVAGQSLTGLMIVLLALSATLLPMLIEAFLAGIGSSLVFLSYITLRALAAPDALLGRVGSTARTVSVGLQPVGMLAAGALLEATGGSATLITLGVATILVSLLFSVSPALRSARVTRELKPA